MADQERPLPASDGNARKDKGKDKDKEPGLAERLQASGRLAINSITAAQPVPNVANPEKTTGSFTGSSRQGSSALYEVATHHNCTSSTGESFKHGVERSGEASRAFEQFQEPSQGNGTISLDKGAPFLQSQVLPRSLTDQESADGHAVVDLLNGPDEDEEPANPTDEYTLSPAAAVMLRATLFGLQSHTSTLSDLLDFTPVFVQHPGDASGAELKQHFGTADPAVARQIWAQQWADVLSSYTDEVWGSLGPLVSDARQEMEQLSEPLVETGQESSETAAVDRLRQILAHVRGHT